jgi:hypothetical protein
MDQKKSTIPPDEQGEVSAADVLGTAPVGSLAWCFLRASNEAEGYLNAESRSEVASRLYLA